MSATQAEVGLRVATLNAFGVREDRAARRTVMRAGLADLDADLVALQEVVVTDEYDQVRDVLGDGYDVAHHTERETDGQGILDRQPVAHHRAARGRPPPGDASVRLRVLGADL